MTQNHIRLNRFEPQVVARADELLARMTLEEKVGQMNQLDHWGPDLEVQVRQGGLGSVLNVHDVHRINQLQRVAVEESRLGIPILFGNDVIHGYRTIFPIPLAESCTWDVGLVERAARVAANEAAACGTDWIFAPMVDICRDPRWGRIAEGAGEDPYLGQAMARAQVRGFQSGHLAGGRKIVSCPKHYVAYGAAEAGKDYNTVDVSERTLRNVYLAPFEAAFEEGAGSVMSAFKEISGVPASANAFTLRTVLRDEWCFEGVVLSDYNALRELILHGFAADLEDAAYKSIAAGVDMDMMGGAFPNHLAELVHRGVVSEDLVDQAVRRILCLKIALGLLDAPYTDESLKEQFVLCPDYRETALEVAHKSMVLLKNKGPLLPLTAHKIALIGPLADARRSPLGCWHCLGQPEDVESVLVGMRAVRPDCDIVHVQGCEITGEENDQTEKAVQAACEAEVAVLVLGESDQMSGEARSRAHLDLPGRQQALLEAVCATGTPVVCVVMAGRPLVLSWMAKHVSTILYAWHGGIRAGRAVADIFFGVENPSAKLTVSFPRTTGQIPVYYGHKSSGRPLGGERALLTSDTDRAAYFDESNQPLYPFGHGLSYTTFAYSNLQIESIVVGSQDTLRANARVTNTGQVAGDEVVQAYVRDRVASVTRPVKELVGFERISLLPGTSETVHFEIPVSSLGFHGLDLDYIVESGEFDLWIAPDSVDGLHGQFTVQEG